MCVFVFCWLVVIFVALSTVVVCNTLDAFAPSPGEGPAAVTAGPAADAFGGSGGWFLFCECVNL